MCFVDIYKVRNVIWQNSSLNREIFIFHLHNIDLAYEIKMMLMLMMMLSILSVVSMHMIPTCFVGHICELRA